MVIKYRFPGVGRDAISPHRDDLCRGSAFTSWIHLLYEHLVAVQAQPLVLRALGNHGLKGARWRADLSRAHGEELDARSRKSFMVSPELPFAPCRDTAERIGPGSR